MEQVDGDLVVNRGDEWRPKNSDGSGRDLNPVEGYDTALKLAQVCLVLDALYSLNLDLFLRLILMN